MNRGQQVNGYPTPASRPSNQTRTASYQEDQIIPVAKKKRHARPHQSAGYYPRACEQQKPKGLKNCSRDRLVYWLVLVLLLAVFTYAVFQLAVYLIQTVKAKQEEQAIQEMIVESEYLVTADTAMAMADEAESACVSPEQSLSPTATPTHTMEAYANTRTRELENKQPDVLIEFLKPLTVNPDTVGKLKLGESINTYVVQRDNTYYLRHAYSGEYSFSGAIFLDVSCSIYPKSRNLILHGHNMRNGTAFGKLIRYESLDYLNRYPIIYFSTLYESAEYIPFAAVFYSIDPESKDYVNLYQVNGFSDQKFIEFVETVQSMSIYHIPVIVGKTDEIITLTTCATDDPAMRFAIFAVKNKL